MKKGLRPDPVDLKSRDKLVGRIDLMKKGLRQSSALKIEGTH